MDNLSPNSSDGLGSSKIIVVEERKNGKENDSLKSSSNGIGDVPAILIPSENQNITETFKKNGVKKTIKREEESPYDIETHNQKVDIRKRKLKHIILLLIGSMFFKFSFESISNSISLVMLNRFPESKDVTYLSITTVLANICQLLGSSFVSPLIKKVRASILSGIIFLIIAVCIFLIIFLELISGGSFWSEEGIIDGSYILAYVCIFSQLICGICIGMWDVLKDIIPPLIMIGSTDYETFEKFNAIYTVCTKIAGTAGAFTSALFLVTMGNVFAMIHVPIMMVAASLFFFILDHSSDSDSDSDSDSKIVEENSSKKKILFSEKVKMYWKSILKSVKEVFMEFFQSTIRGFKFMFLNYQYNFVTACYIVPDVINGLRESIIIPTYCEQIMNKEYFTGIMLGSSNFGEMIGAFLIFILSFYKIKVIPLSFVIIGMIFVNFLWLFPLIDWKYVPPEFKTSTEIILVSSIVLIALGFSMGNITILSYVQTIQDKRDLFASLSFMYLVIILISASFSYGLGRVTDLFDKIGLPRRGLLIVMSGISLLSIFVIVMSMFGCFFMKKRKVKK